MPALLCMEEYMEIYAADPYREIRRSVDALRHESCWGQSLHPSPTHRLLLHWKQFYYLASPLGADQLDQPRLRPRETQQYVLFRQEIVGSAYRGLTLEIQGLTSRSDPGKNNKAPTTPRWLVLR